MCLPVSVCLGLYACVCMRGAGFVPGSQKLYLLLFARQQLHLFCVNPLS